MHLTFKFGVLAGVCLAGAALAHDGVRNPAVMARMENMSAMSEHMEVLVTMARGTTPFSASTANDALSGLSEVSAETVALFEPEERDPRDEASADIWTEFQDFTRLAHDLEDTARTLSGTISESADLGQVLRSVGQACAACHDLYRLD